MLTRMDVVTRHSSLRARLTVLGVIAATLALAAIAISASTMHMWQDSLVERGDARTSLVEVSELTRALTDQDTNIRGYIAARDEQFVEPYRQGVVLERTMTERLATNPISSNAEVAEQIDRLVAASARWRTDVAETALDPDQPMPSDELARDRFSAVTVELDVLATLVSSEVERTAGRTADMQRLVTTVLIGSAVVAVASILVVGLLFRRWVTRPLAAIGEGARRMAMDDTVVWPDVPTAELQDVTAAIRGLQRSLTVERDRALTAYHGLEQSALLALHVRSELANQLGDPPPGWSIGSALVPAEGLVAGDCYDSGYLDQRHLYAIMIDVTGHGAIAALDALKVKTQLRAALRSRLDPGSALEWISRQNRRDDGVELFTAVVVVIDITDGTCRYANAGHPPPILTDGNEHRALKGTGPLLGAFAATWRTDSLVIEPGWTLLLYTDGVTEALGSERERFGEDRLAARLHEAEITDADALVDHVIASVDEFRTGPRTDDIAMLVVHRSGEEPVSDPPARQHLDQRPMDTVQA